MFWKEYPHDKVYIGICLYLFHLNYDNYLSQLTNKSFGSLLSQLHTERSWHVRFITEAFDSYMAFFVERSIRTTIILAFAVLRRCTLVASYTKY